MVYEPIEKKFHGRFGGASPLPCPLLVLSEHSICSRAARDNYCVLFYLSNFCVTVLVVNTAVRGVATVAVHEITVPQPVVDSNNNVMRRAIKKIKNDNRPWAFHIHYSQRSRVVYRCIVYYDE